MANPIGALFGRSPIRPIIEHMAKAQNCVTLLGDFLEASFSKDWQKAEVLQQAIRAAEKLRPEVGLMDLEMPELGGLEATRRIKEQHPEIGVVILTIHGSDEVREQAVRAGSDAFIEKEAPTEDLIAAIREVRATNCPNSKGEGK